MDQFHQQFDLYVGLTAVGCCTFLLTWSLYQIVKDAADMRQIVTDAPKPSAHSPMIRMLRPFARVFGGMIGGMSARIEVKVGRDASKSFLLSTRVRIQKQLLAAGMPEGLTPDEFIGLVIVGALSGSGLGVFLWAKFQMPVLILGGSLMGLFLPSIWLRDLTRKRQFQIQRTLPFALDLLTLSVEAGLDFTTAVGKIVDKLGDSPLASELSVMLREIQLGKSRTDALRDLAHRVSVAEMTSVTSSLIQAEELGASLGPILRVQGEQLRNSRSQRAEKTAMEAPVKILLPLIAFIFPNTFIIIGGPILLEYLIPMFGGK